MADPTDLPRNGAGHVHEIGAEPCKRDAPRTLDPYDVLDRLERREDRASQERAAQTTAFTRALDRQNAVNERGFNRLYRVGVVMGSLLIAGILALAGVQVTYGAKPAPLTLSSPVGDAMPVDVVGVAP